MRCGSGGGKADNQETGATEREEEFMDASMLSEADRARLTAEEVFRQEVRDSLKEPKTRGEKALEFFNSSLGILVLSTVVLGGLSAAGTKWWESHQRRVQDRETVRRLDVEIAFRLQQIPLLNKEMVSFTELNTVKGALAGKNDVNPQIGSLGDFEPIFPEFTGRTLFFLIWELQRTLPEDQKTTFEKPLAAAKLLPWFVHEMGVVKPVGEEDSQWSMPEADRVKFAQTFSSIQLPRWKP